jgi:hypothetical protein
VHWNNLLIYPINWHRIHPTQFPILKTQNG